MSLSPGDGVCSGVCSSCRMPFDKSRKRRLIDSCGHERCYSCIFRNDICPLCLETGEWLPVISLACAQCTVHSAVHTAQCTVHSAQLLPAHVTLSQDPVPTNSPKSGTRQCPCRVSPKPLRQTRSNAKDRSHLKVFSTFLG